MSYTFETATSITQVGHIIQNVATCFYIIINGCKYMQLFNCNKKLYKYTNASKKLFNVTYVSPTRSDYKDIPVVNTQHKQSSQHIDMLHPYQYFSSTLDHLYPW